MNEELLVTIALFAIAILLLYYYGTCTYGFWISRDVKGPKPEPFFGNTRRTLYGKDSFAHIITKVYKEYKDEPMVGVFQGRVPILVVRDPELIKTILVKDFTQFANRTKPPDLKIDLFSEDLFNLDAERWRPLRSQLTPVFTSVKLKQMFPLMLECSDEFESHLETLVATNDVVECRELAEKFTIDVIGSCAFGIEMNALSNESCEFRRMGRKIFQTNWLLAIKDRIKDFPIIYNTVGPLIVDKVIINFFINVTKDAIDYRIKNNLHRHDFIEVLVDLKKHPEKIGLDEFSYKFAASQSFVFFGAGYETSSLTISNALYEIAKNHVVQEELRKEILNVLRKNDGKITYENISEMTYLHAFINEVLRMYPPVLYLMRVVMKSYTFPGTKTTVPKGQQVLIPCYGIQYDPDIYPEPEVFDPKRFLGENAKNRHPMHFLPFGNGPRDCIGRRFANYQTKIGIISIVKDYKIDVCEKTEIPYRIELHHTFLLQPAHDIYVRMTKLKV